jgi:hypothetical protein
MVRYIFSVATLAHPSKKKDSSHGLPSLSLVFGYIAVKELSRIQDRVDVLSRLGYGNPEIAKICGISSDVVAVLKYRARKERPKRSRAL